MPETRKKTKPAKKEEMTITVNAIPEDPQAPPKPKIGRPTDYSDELAAHICTRIANGEALRQICMEEGMPVHSTVYLWLTKNPTFSDMYTRAREDQADTLADEIQAIADQMPMETTDKDGNTRFDPSYINWMRLRVDARKWTASKLKPRKYGDRVELAGDKENPLQINAQIETKSLFSTILNNLELKKQV
jgi:hypothetical protein